MKKLFILIILSVFSFTGFSQTRPDTLKRKTEKKSKPGQRPKKQDTLKRDTMRCDTARRMPPR